MASQKALRSANDLRPGESGIIHDLSGTPVLCDHLKGLGFFPGETIVMELRTTLGDPIVLRLGLTKVALRKNEAASILLRDLK